MSRLLPKAARPFVDFPILLRLNGFSVAPQQTIGFVQAVGLLGPRHMHDIYRAARAMLGPEPERLAEFDALFRAFFWGQTLSAAATNDEDHDTLRVQEEGDSFVGLEDLDEAQESGGQAATGEMLNTRAFAAIDEATVLRRFRRAAPVRLPMRRAYRHQACRRGNIQTLRPALRQAVRHGGEILHLPTTRRKPAQRRILLLIDVSGSMKTYTDSYLRLAHSLGRVATRLEVFTLGTRLTRITTAIRRRQRDQALTLAANLVSDWDGGTRIGDALEAFLTVPRFASFARGSLVLVLSDGLERGDHTAMTNAIRHLTRLAWRLDWLSPDAGGTGFVPRTAALQSILPYVDHLGGGGSVAAVADHLLNVARERRR